MPTLDIPDVLLDPNDPTLTALPDLRVIAVHVGLLEIAQENLTVSIIKKLYQDAVAKGVEDDLDGAGWQFFAEVTSMAVWNADVPGWVGVSDVVTDPDTDPPTTRTRKVSEMPGPGVRDGRSFISLAYPTQTLQETGRYGATETLPLKTIGRILRDVNNVQLIRAEDIPEPPEA